MHDVLYTLGQIARVVWPAGNVPNDVVAQLLTHPLRGIALAQRKEAWRKASQEDLARLIDKLPSDLDDPKNGIAISDQYPFWAGYYRYNYYMDVASLEGGITLPAVGNAIWGEHWQTPMAEALGLSGTARIRAWLAGQSLIPAGVWSDLDALLRQRQSRLSAIIDALPDPMPGD